MKLPLTKLVALVITACVAVPAANADIIGNFEQLNFDSPGLPGNGQFDLPATITADTSNLYGGAAGTLVFNLSGLDVTGDSTANDSASLTFDVTAAGGNIADTGSTGLQIGITGNGAAGLSDPSELLTISFGSGSVTLGDAGTGAAVNFIGFRNLGLNGFGAGETLTISGGTSIDGTFTGSDQSPFDSGNALGNVSSFTINAGATDNFSLDRFGARIEFQGTAAAVPEPSSVLLLSAGCLGLAIQRRRNRRRRTPSDQ